MTATTTNENKGNGGGISLRIVDVKMMMEDQDVGEMFLNFQLHPNTTRFAAVDLGPLGFTSSECLHRWMWWTRNLMGFRPTPYNSIQMYLISEEIIQGDHGDPGNAFQWSHLLLNLPGMKGYKPLLAWVSKWRKDGSLASDFTCFVDDLRIMGEGRERVAEAGHTISTRESYLGIQGALQKLRCLGRTKTPGACWAGASICIDNDIWVVVLTLQEKWDCMKNIFWFWLDLLNQGVSELDHKQLKLDCGFMVYVVQAYPWMKPYLKGFHLSLERWREGQDSEGWKIYARPASEEDDTREDISDEGNFEEHKIQLLTNSLVEEEAWQDSPSS
jgi:hypothetical protein